MRTVSAWEFPGRRISFLGLAGLLILSALALAPDVRADRTSVAWTTTADFDLGDASDGGTDWFAMNGVDQPFLSYTTVPNAVYVPAKDRTYVTWQGGNEFLPYVSYYDHGEGRWATPVSVAAKNPITGDGHGAPAIWVESDGYVLVLYGSHANAQKIARSRVPYDISEWASLPDLTPSSTYPNLLEYRGTIYYFYRNWASSEGDWVYQASRDHGMSWSSPITLIDMGVTDSQYTGGWRLQDGKVYWVWVKYVTALAMRRNVYLCYLDLEDGNAYALDGTDLGPQVDAAEAEDHCRVWTGGSTVQTSWARADVLDGVPYIVYAEGVDSGATHTWWTNFTRWDGGTWTAPVTIVTTDANSNHADLRAISETDVEAFLTTSGVDHGCPGDCEYSGDLERWTWDGDTWTRAETIRSEVESGYPVNFPSVPVGARDDLRLVFAEFGSLVAGANAQRLKLYAWGSNGFVRNAALAAGWPSVETESDQFEIPSGAFRIAGSRGDRFTAESAPETNRWQALSAGDGSRACTMSIRGGVLNFTWREEPGGTGRTTCVERSKWAISGDFDVRAKYGFSDDPDTMNARYALCVLDTPDVCDAHYAASTDGMYMYRLRTAVGDNWFTTWKLAAGARTQLGANANSACNPCWLRITRAGDVFTSYFSDTGLSWTEHRQVVLPGAGGRVYVHLTMTTNAVTTGTVSVEVDDLSVALGSRAPAYRTSASWTSPVQPYAGEIVRTITVDYSEASDSGFIDALEVVDANGDVLYSEETDRKAGRSAVFAIPPSVELSKRLERAWAVRIVLTGDGTSSPNIEAITAELEPPPTNHRARIVPDDPGLPTVAGGPGTPPAASLPPSSPRDRTIASMGDGALTADVYREDWEGSRWSLAALYPRDGSRPPRLAPTGAQRA